MISVQKKRKKLIWFPIYLTVSTTPDVDNRPEDPSDRTKRMDEITQVAEEETQEESYMSKLLADTQEESPIEQSDSQSQQISSNASDPELEKATPVQEQVNQLPPYIKTQSLKENWLKDLPPDLSDLPNLDVIGPETQDAVRSIERHKPRFRLMESVPDSPELNETLKDSRSDTTLDGSETTTTSISVIDKPKTPVAQSTPIANQKTQALHQSLPEKVVEIQEEEPWYHDPFENLERIYQRRSDPPNVEKDQSQKRERRVDEEGYSDLSEGSGNSSREMPPPDSELTLAIKNQKQLKSQVSKNSIREIESLVPKILPLTTVSSGSPVNLSRIFEPTSNQVKDSSSNVSDKFKSLDIYQNGSLGNEYDSQSSYIIPRKFKFLLIIAFLPCC
ncbi:expressed protein [Phakopsora pachyrhizi]|uniref:Expressed protein n=1 Tax=Phakopsora pachyrhizi TaxID=170000 RepID=A0AAV0BDP2_PHAPC|nr:expressed protein [Phakopsora pachyrhizi]